MAREQSGVAFSHRLLSLGAVALLVSAGALGFARVFQGGGATLKLLAAAVGSVVVAGLSERRGPVLAVLISAAGLLIAIGLLVFPNTVYGIFPTAKTFSASNRSLRSLA